MADRVLTSEGDDLDDFTPMMEPQKTNTMPKENMPPTQPLLAVEQLGEPREQSITAMATDSQIDSVSLAGSVSAALSVAMTSLRLSLVNRQIVILHRQT